MPKSTISTNCVSDALAAITKTADALFKHTSKAISIQKSTMRTTMCPRREFCWPRFASGARHRQIERFRNAAVHSEVPRSNHIKRMQLS